MSPGLRVSHLHKRYGAVAALSDVSFSLRSGEVLGLLGPNGAGKTTLFECVAGLLPADSGTVTIDGREVPGEARGAHLFYLPDGIAPWPAQTVAWALDFMLGLFGGDRTRLPAIVDRLQIGALEWILGSEPGPGRNNAPPNPDLFPANNPVLRPPVSGRVGLWAKTDSTSYFKDYVVVTK